MYTVLYSFKASSHSRYDTISPPSLYTLLNKPFTVAHLLSIDVQKIETNIWQYNCV